MAIADQQHIVRRWFSEWTADPPAFGRATDWLGKLIDRNPERALDFVTELTAQAPSEAALDLVGSGPLEDLLVWHGSVLIERVEQIAATSPRFKTCLRNVWGSDTMDPAIHGRMRRAAGMDAAS